MRIRTREPAQNIDGELAQSLREIGTYALGLVRGNARAVRALQRGRAASISQDRLGTRPRPAPLCRLSGVA